MLGSPTPSTSQPHKSQKWPQKPVCVLDDTSEGPGTPGKYDDPTEPSTHPGLLVGVASALGGTGLSPGLSPPVGGI